MEIANGKLTRAELYINVQANICSSWDFSSIPFISFSGYPILI